MLGRALGERAERFGSQLKLHAPDTLGLNIDREGTTGMALGVTDFITSAGSAAGQITSSAHRISLRVSCHGQALGAPGGLRYYFGYGIIFVSLWQECFWDVLELTV